MKITYSTKIFSFKIGTFEIGLSKQTWPKKFIYISITRKYPYVPSKTNNKAI